jgi:ATP-dependent Clp protease ATP-binding subunit ClpC
MDIVEKVFRPEFLNRLDDVIVFRHLTTDDLKSVVDLELSKVRERLADRGLKLILTDESKAYIVRKASKGEQENPFGARPLRREVERLIEDPLSEELLKGEFQGKDTITVDVVKDDTDKVRRLDFKGSVSTTPPQPAAEPVGAGADEAK